jgi:mono/diheme cytochrome c family protein
VETFATLQKRIFTPSCAIPSCHGSAASGGLTLTADASYAQLVGVPATNPTAAAAGVLRVVPGDPDRSFLLRKLEGTLAGGEGEPMPRVGTTLSPALLDLVRRWIVAGAPADTPF